ncbi:MAG: sugar phosphate nucleotidyltransferase [Clostridia bacterium]|nr:sugar phosphate nucleotidyltransferase [Clostridia bacterium]
MHIILLSGGSGKRLWPLSNEIRSKQFLKILKNKDNEPQSMIQRVYSQIREAGINADIVVATGSIQADSIKSQLNDLVDIVSEPQRRDTFPAIALSCAYLALEKGMSLDEVVLVLPVDPFAEMNYFTTLIDMEHQIKTGAANLALMGIRPTYPSQKYGYIMPKGCVEPKVYAVDRFQEKPSEAYAAELIASGALWNGGVFAFKLGYIINILKQYIKYKTFSDVEQKYGELPKISFDYEVVEKEKSIVMVEYVGIWKDLGTWNTLTEVMESKAIGKVTMSSDCENTHAINELGIPLVIMGAKDMVVAASPDGILVSDKHQSSYLKEYIQDFNQRPMYEERRWGEYKVLDYNSYEDTCSLTKYIVIKAGKFISYQLHHIRDEVWTIVNGTGDLVIDGHVRNVRRGDVVYITRGQKHAIRATTDLHVVEVQIGAELIETDIERFEWNW